MKRVYIICEGQTEEMFVNEIMNDIFQPHNVYLRPILIKGKNNKIGGGDISFSRLCNDIQKCLNDKSAYCTTFFDFYGLPNDFPGKVEALTYSDISKKQDIVQKALLEKLSQIIDENTLRRFLPYVQMYEFEGLLFSLPQSIAEEIGKKALSQQFVNIRNNFDTPEHINNSEQTAPNKRIQNLYPEYDKVIHGSLIALNIGITTIQKECKLFNQWIQDIFLLCEK